MANTDTTLPPEVAEAKVLRIAKRLIALSDAAANRDWNEFSMRVPAEPERDADLVLTSAAQELVSLAEENARLRESAQQIERECLEAWKQATHSRSCAKVAESELADVRRKWADAESKLAACDDDLRLVLAERDALKARIADSGKAACRNDGGLVGPSLIAYMAEEDVGKTFALLKLEDGE